jgi:hypothetical protein
MHPDQPSDNEGDHMKKLTTMLEDELLDPIRPLFSVASKSNFLAVTLLALGTLLTAPVVVHADLSILTPETLMDAQMSDMLALETYAGSDFSTALQFDYAFDPNAGSFSYSLLPGQQWLGQSFSLSGTGTYDPSTTTFIWTTTGQLGTAAWTGQGTIQWAGDAPTGESASGLTIGGVNYTMLDDLNVTPNVNPIVSSGTVYLVSDNPKVTWGPIGVFDTQSNNSMTIWTPASNYPISGGIIKYTQSAELEWAGTAYFRVVAEPTTMIAGALLLLPFGACTLRNLRKRQTA